MPNAPVEHSGGKFRIVRSIKVVDRETLTLVAKVLGITAEKAEQMHVGNVYIAQDADPSSPAVDAKDKLAGSK